MFIPDYILIIAASISVKSVVYMLVGRDIDNDDF